MPRTVLVTGSSSGLGRATAELFHRVGWNVAATARDPGAWRGASSERLLPLALDVTDPVSVTTAFEQAVERFGGLDGVVNVAGIGLLGPFETSTEDDARLVFETNTFGPVRVMREAVPHLRSSGGVLVNVTAGSALTAEPLTGLYNASKAALDVLSESLRYELAAQGIAVRLVEPGFVPTTDFAAKVFAAASQRDVPLEYRDYVQQRTASFDSAEPPSFTTAEEVADAVLEAATDRTHRLRWTLGGDLAERLRMRHETSEAEYDAWTWREFAPTPDPTTTPRSTT
jgi:NAD(P)-dependent dehydrogenase (short-subunit alcohol dehydrogenase family)